MYHQYVCVSVWYAPLWTSVSHIVIEATWDRKKSYISTISLTIVSWWDYVKKVWCLSVWCCLFGFCLFGVCLFGVCLFGVGFQCWKKEESESRHRKRKGNGNEYKWRWHGLMLVSFSIQCHKRGDDTHWRNKRIDAEWWDNGVDEGKTDGGWSNWWEGETQHKWIDSTVVWRKRVDEERHTCPRVIGVILSLVDKIACTVQRADPSCRET